MGSNVVILGGGFGGARAALVARQLLNSEHRVTLIDRQDTAHLCGMNPMMVVGERQPETTSRSLRHLEGHGIEFVQAEITSIEPKAHEVITDSGTVPFDYLVVALGASYAWDAVPGSADAHSFYSFESAVRLREELVKLPGGRIVIAAAKPPYKCPPAPFEMGMLLHGFFAQRGLRGDFEIDVFIPEPVPMGVAGADAAARVRSSLDERQIGLHAAAGVVAVENAEVAFSDGSSAKSDLTITIPIHRCPEVVVASGLTGEKPWVPVDADTLETSEPDVFAIGDVNSIPLGEGKAVPKAGVFASGQAETVAAVIAARINEDEPPPPYDGHGECFLTFSSAEAALVGGTFLAEEGPRVGLGEQSAEGMRLKEAFEDDWRQFLI